MNTDKYASLDSLVSVVFGDAYISCNGEIIYQEEHEDMGLLTLNHFEAIAKIKPNKDWKFVIYGPLWGATWKRIDEGKWLLLESNEGFA